MDTTTFNSLSKTIAHVVYSEVLLEFPNKVLKDLGIR